MKSLVVILVLKLVEPIGKKFDKKKPVKEDLTQIDELINPNINLPFGGDRITHNHGGAAPFLVGNAAGLRLHANLPTERRRKKKKKKRKNKKKKRKNNPKQPMNITAAP